MYIIGMGKSVPQGAVTTINCAVNPTLNSQHAIYYSEGPPKQPSATARSEMLHTIIFSLTSSIHFDHEVTF